ncbi:MAG: SUMF1/EgtB/PvdO family nonheme iron enzyme [Planctomycetota bacterium]|nr:SUMF1/EgtB/PvdO family nonheme iron enzyme [Planctomycetota bacterium]
MRCNALALVVVTLLVPSTGAAQDSQRQNRPPPEAVDPLNRPIWIEGGTFSMGSEDRQNNERPVHQVTVSGFWMQEHEVTNDEYRRFILGHQFAREYGQGSRIRNW